VGVLVVGTNFTQAWQNPRTRVSSNLRLDDADPAEQVDRSVPGQITLASCSIKLLHSVVLATDRPGLIARVEPNEGDEVRKDQAIVFIKDEVLQATYNVAKLKAENDVNKRYALKSADVSKAILDRMLDANRSVKSAVTGIEIDRAQMEFEKALLQGEQADKDQSVAKAEMEKADAELKACRIEAPFDGKVRKVLKHKGESVTQGTPILELVSTQVVKVEGYLPIEDLWSVKVGDPVEVRLDIPDRDLEIEKEVFVGKITFKDVSVSPVTAGCRITAEVQNPDEKLIEGLYAKMTIKHGRRAAGTAKKPAPNGTGIKPASATK
jgi:macrolide-specific efflux system membrane fusion protein